ncbi:MAG: PQQ-like beta-propeller repeat protein [Planctomycetes bacterium]|nr:PQQ-like beta-propeller repeat protein [Planctomycetota bacterium]
MERKALAVLVALALGAARPAPAGEPHLDYAVDEAGALYALDLAALTTRRIGHIQAGDERPVLGDLVATPDGYLYGFSDTTVYLINLTEPARSQRVGEHGLDNPYGVGLGPGGQVYAMTRDGRVFVVDPTTARAREVGALGGGFRASGDMALMGEVFYASVKDPGRVEHLVTIDPRSGRATHVAPFTEAATGAPVPNVFGLLARGGVLYAMTSSGDILRVDPATARCTLLARTGIRWWGATEYLRL